MAERAGSRGAPSVVSSMRSAAVTSGAERIEQVAREARLLAMAGNASAEYYGVVVYCAQEVGTNRPRYYAALTYGTTAEEATILRAGGVPVLQVVLNRNVQIQIGSDHADHAEDTAMAVGDAYGWLHQYRTGHVVASNSPTAAAISVGTPASPIVGELTVRTLDGSKGARFAAYPIGLTGVEDLDL